MAQKLDYLGFSSTEGFGLVQ